MILRTLSLLLATLTIGCAMPVQSNSTSMISSTQGSTLVRMATIINVGSAVIADGEPAVAGEVIMDNVNDPPNGQSVPTRTVTELLLRFDDGATFTYQIEPGATFQAGERVKVIARRLTAIAV
jgi:outer membrane lipoprotein SlyB